MVRKPSAQRIKACLIQMISCVFALLQCLADQDSLSDANRLFLNGRALDAASERVGLTQYTVESCCGAPHLIDVHLPAMPLQAMGEAGSFSKAAEALDPVKQPSWKAAFTHESLRKGAGFNGGRH